MSPRALPLALPALLALSACRSPTQITVTVRTDVLCSQVTSTSFTAGELGAIEGNSPTTESTTCGDDGHLGTVVLVPSGGEDEEVAFKVVTALNGETFDRCNGDAGANDTSCIVSRRALRYLPHTPLEVIVDMTKACEGLVCDPYSTCVNSVCAPATIPDPAECEGTGCTQSVLLPGDAGVDATTGDATTGDATASDATLDSEASLPEGGDAQPPTDSSLVDSPPPIEASTFDGAVLGCDLGGLQPGSPWPMDSYCPSLRARSPLAGPAATPAPVHKWGVALNGFGYAPPTIGADGTVYVSSIGDALPDGGNAVLLGGAVTAIHPDGGVFWTYAPDAGASFDTNPVIAADSTLRVFDLFSAQYFQLGLDGHLIKNVPSFAPSRGGLTIVTGGTMYVPDNQADLVAYADDGTVQWFVQSVGYDYCFPSVGPTGTIFAENNGNVATGVFPDGGLYWQHPLDSGPPSTLGSFIVALDGTLRVYDSNGDLWSLDESGAERWHHNVAAAGSVQGMAVGDDGTAYLGTDGVLVAVDQTGADAGTQSGSFSGPVIDANGDVYAVCNDGYLCSYDHTLTVERWAPILVPDWIGYDPNGRPVIGPGGMVYVITTSINGTGAIHAIGPP